MIIDPDVAHAARHFGVDAALIQAVVNAEGDIIKAIKLDPPRVITREEALWITCRSAVHAMSDFLREHGDRSAFVDFWAARWAPVGAENDPKNLNTNWPRNVKAIWIKGGR